MYKVLLCVEKKDFHYKEKQINGVKCVIFGWTNYELDKYEYDIYGVRFEKERLKNGYILMEFEDLFMVNFKNRSKIPELEQAMNLNKIITRDDFSIVFNEKENEEEEEYE